MNIKTIKNSIAFLAVIAFVASASQASAYVPGLWDPQPYSINAGQPAFTKAAITYDAPVTYQNPNGQVINGTNNSATQNGYFGNGNGNTSSGSNGSSNLNTNSNSTNSSNTSTVASNTQNTRTVAVATPARVRNTTATTTTYVPVQGYTNQYYNPNQLRPVVTTPVDNNGLTALSIAGSGGFMPSSLWQWILVVMFILAIIIIIRMLGRHDHHEVHTVTSH